MRKTSKFSFVAAVTAAFALALSGLALADTIESNTDGDSVVGQNPDDKRLTFGQVCATTGSDGVNGGNGLAVDFHIKRGTNTNTGQTFGDSVDVDFGRRSASSSEFKVSFGTAAGESVAGRLNTGAGWVASSSTAMVGPLPAAVRYESTATGPVDNGSKILRVEGTGLNNAGSSTEITRVSDELQIRSTTVVDEVYVGGTVDCTKPGINITAPAASATIEQGTSATATFDCTDAASPNGVAASGVATGGCTGLVTKPDTTETSAAASGFTLPTADLGVHTLSVRALDNAGNVTTATRSYEVVPPAVDGDWSAVRQPINANGTSTFKAGKGVIPVKFQWLDEDGNVVKDANVAPQDAELILTRVSGGTPGTVTESLTTGSANTGCVFRYDEVEGNYVYNLSAKGLSAGTYAVEIHHGDVGTSDAYLFTVA